MGLLDQVIGGVLGQVLGGGHGREQSGAPSSGGALGGAMLPIVQALLMLLMSKGAGGHGDILGGGHAGPQEHQQERRGPDDGDIGGFGQDRGGAPATTDRGSQGGGEFGDLSGMLDGPGDRPNGGDTGAGSQAQPNHESGVGQGGLDGLIDRFQRGGLGDMMESWIGHGQNRPVQPTQLADALGPETINALQQRTGLDRNDLLSQLAQALPQVIDRLTPQGRRPNGDESRGW
ncbi:DUF937 domain-containing protein [Methylobacterium sp. BTF04]|uniref:YidB family protein n=1 Tax=Methylobacterium sp. BTF04 TaxID=2708300 RepID=UPI0013D58B40|nr:YidB family protein [Methylobacterium sp. BTF04]NEU11025.1 DUF937 domain-containing protein [Methylobacterium sp. BTF04]